MKDISIITIAYKDPNGLTTTLKSLEPLLAAKISWEHVIVDSSPEEHKAALLDRNHVWPRIYIAEPPEGIYAAMNRGWRSSNGKLLWFLNSGDHLKSIDELNSAVKAFADDQNLDLLVTTPDLTRNGEYLYSKNSHSSFLRNILGSNHICHQAVLYRRSSFEKIGEFSTKYKLASDYEHLFRCYIGGLKQKVSNARIVQFDMGGASSNFWKVLKEYELVHKSLAPMLPRKLVLLNRILLQGEKMRLTLVKTVANSRLSQKLRPAWLWWHRRGNAP